jgi:hypothetical protein
MTEVRESIVSLLIAGCAGEIDADAYAATYAESTADKRLATARTLARAAREFTRPPTTDPPSLLSLDLAGLTRAAADDFRRGAAKAWLRDQLDALWVSRPSASLGDILKTQRADRLAYFERELAVAGLRLDDGNEHPAPRS